MQKEVSRNTDLPDHRIGDFAGEPARFFTIEESQMNDPASIDSQPPQFLRQYAEMGRNCSAVVTPTSGK
jgi:hypothetical protein